MDQSHRARQIDLVGFDDDHLALDAAQLRLAVSSAKAAAIDHDAFGIGRIDVAVKLYLAACREDARMQLRQHAPRLDMALVGIEQAFAETAFQGWFEFAQRLRL